MSQPSTQFHVTLNEQERRILVSIMEQVISETHSEARRTEAPDYRDLVHQQQALLQQLLDKLRAA